MPIPTKKTTPASSTRLCVTTQKELKKVQDAWPVMFNSNARLRASLQDLLDEMGVTDYLDWERIPTDWAGFCNAFAAIDFSLSMTAIAGTSPTADSPKVYAMATYAWDDGNATGVLNLKQLATSSIFSGGPGAALVVRKNARFPGLALHLSEAENTVLVQLF